MHHADLRVSKGLGPKGYGKVRISAITHHPRAPSADFNFTYSAQFRYRWKQHYLHSALIDLGKAGKHSLRLEGQHVLVNLPEPHSGTRSILLSDPCFNSEVVECEYAKEWDILNRTTSLLNTAFNVTEGRPDMLAILGDNFYDSAGDLSPVFFSKLSANVKASFLAVVMGNHDIWGCGNSLCGLYSDQQGYGQMQYFPMDTLASTSAVGGNDADFLAFDVDPDIGLLQYGLLLASEATLLVCILALLFYALRRCACGACKCQRQPFHPIPASADSVAYDFGQEPPVSNIGHGEEILYLTPPKSEDQGVKTGLAGGTCCMRSTQRGGLFVLGLLLILSVVRFEFVQPWHTFSNNSNNFIWYHRLGNLGLVGFSGAATWQETQPHLQAACEFFGSERPDAIILMGHWNEENMGCSSADMTTPAVRRAMSRMPGCREFGEKLKYFNGHEHCNLIQELSPSGEARGFQIGGHGMSSSACFGDRGKYGFAFLDSTSGRLRIHYFDLAPTAEGDPFQKLYDCVKSQGLHRCTHLSDQWLDIDIS